MRPGALLRSTGADLPGGDPRAHHGVPMEGYYWRIVTASRVVVALCGITSRRGGPPEGLVALATAPDHVTVRRVAAVECDDRTLGLSAGSVLQASAGHLAVDVGAGERLEVALAGAAWPRRSAGGLGPAGWLPGLAQYWHPHLLGARALGTLVTGGREERVDGSAYAEKNWGRAFPERWWWAEAHDADTCVALAGGVALAAGRLRFTATAMVVRDGGRLVRLGPPTGLVRAAAADGRWVVRGWTGRRRVDVEAVPGPGPAARLPLPPPPGGPGRDHVEQHLDGVLRVRWREGARTVLDREIAPAGMEAGTLR